MLMAVTGAALVLFVTFHCLLNAIAICWPTTYNSVCMFLGANWYALLASIGLAALIVIHIVYAVVLTMKNRSARGDKRYAVSKRPKTVEWSSNNMLVLGIVILAFLVVHLIQFWAKMQLAEIRGAEEVIPPTAGTLFIQEAFALVWTPIVYIIGFVALWFHLQHGMWSMFQSVGWDSNVWLPRLKKIACWWTTIVVGVFIAQAIVFTVRAHENYYKTNPELRAQYMTMVFPMYERDFGPAATQLEPLFASMPYDQLSDGISAELNNYEGIPDSMDDPEIQQQLNMIPDMDYRAQRAEQMEQAIRMKHAWTNLRRFCDYLEGIPEKAEEPQIMVVPGQQPAPAPQQVQVQQETVEVTEAPEQSEPVEQPAATNTNKTE